MKGSTASRPSAWRFAAPWLIIGLTVLTFWPASDAGFVNWDDDDLIEKNTARLTLSGENLRWMFTTSFFGHYQPLSWLSLALDHLMWGGKPSGYHITNVGLHALTAVAFFYVARRLLALAGRNASSPASLQMVVAATFAALVFACHPLRVESVAWLAERRDVLSGLFYLIAIACYLRHATSANEAPPTKPNAPILKSFHWLATAVLFTTLSLLSKAIAMTLPFVLLILDVFPLRRLGGKSGWWNQLTLRVWMEKIPFGLLGVVFAIRALVAQIAGGVAAPLSQHDWIERFFQVCYGMAFYLWKTLIPTELGPLYQIPSRSVLLGPKYWICAALVICAGIVVWSFRRKMPGVVAALAAYAVILSPVSGIAQSGPQFVADRYSYLPCLGFAVLAGWGLLRAMSSSSFWLRHAAVWAAIGVVVLLSRTTSLQTKLWHDELSLWTHGARISPDSSFAQCNYADALARAKRYQEAYPVYQRTLQLDPKDAVALHHFGDLHLVTKQPDIAIDYYRRTIAVDPGRTTVHFGLARLLVGKGRFGEAIAVLRDGGKRHPDELDMVDYLADILATLPEVSLRNGEEAVEWASKASAGRRHRHVPYLLTLATALAEAGRFDEAVSTIERALPLADAAGQRAYADELRRRMKLFQERRPFHYED